MKTSSLLVLGALALAGGSLGFAQTTTRVVNANGDTRNQSAFNSALNQKPEYNNGQSTVNPSADNSSTSPRTTPNKTDMGRNSNNDDAVSYTDGEAPPSTVAVVPEDTDTTATTATTVTAAPAATVTVPVTTVPAATTTTTVPVTTTTAPVTTTPVTTTVPVTSDPNTVTTTVVPSATTTVAPSTTTTTTPDDSETTTTTTTTTNK